MHTILEALLALDGLRSSTPLHIIGGVIDRGFSLNDYDVVALDNTLAMARLEKADLPGLHLVPRSWLDRDVLPPSVRLGSRTLWDFALEGALEAGEHISSPHSIESLGRLARFLEEKLRAGNSNIKILSAGFGDGVELELLAAILTGSRGTGGEVVGIDTHPEAVSRAREKGFEAYLMDMNLLDFEDSTFDLYVSHHSLEHSIAPCLALSEAYRVLLPGGHLLLVVPTGYDHPSHRYNFTPEMVENMVRTAGFTIQESTTERSGFFDQVRVWGVRGGGIRCG